MQGRVARRLRPTAFRGPNGVLKLSIINGMPVSATLKAVQMGSFRLEATTADFSGTG